MKGFWTLAMGLAVLAGAGSVRAQSVNIDSISDTMTLQDTPVRTDTDYQVFSIKITTTGSPNITSLQVKENGTVSETLYLTARAYISQDAHLDAGDIPFGSAAFVAGVATVAGTYTGGANTVYYILWVVDVANNALAENTTIQFEINATSYIGLAAGSVTSTPALPVTTVTRTIPVLYRVPSEYASLVAAEGAVDDNLGVWDRPRVIQVEDNGTYGGVDFAGAYTPTAANNLICRSKKGFRPIIDSPNNLDGYSSDIPYVTMKGFRFNGVTASGAFTVACAWIYDDGDFNTIENCTMYGNDGSGVRDINADVGCAGLRVINCTVYKTGGNRGSLVLEYDGVTGHTLKNNIFVDTRVTTGRWYIGSAGVLAASDYNCWYAPNQASMWNIALTDKTFAQWKSDLAGISADVNSLSTDPLLTDASPDLYLKSTCGVPTTWARTGTATTDHSPCIDAADPADSYLFEPYDHGGRRNMGSYGNTTFASKSASQLPTNTWTGAGGTTDWNTNANWSAGVPLGGSTVNGTANCHAVVIRDSAFDPVVSTANAVARSVDVRAGGSLTISNTASDFFLDVGDGGVTISGALSLSSGGDGTERVTCSGSFTVNSGATFAPTSGDVHLDGTAAATLTMNAGNFWNLRIWGTGPGNTKTVTLATGLTVNGTYLSVRNATFNAGANPLTLTNLVVNGDPLNFSGTGTDAAACNGSGDVSVKNAYWRPGSSGTISAGIWTFTDLSGSDVDPVLVFNAASGGAAASAADYTGSTSRFRGTASVLAETLWVSIGSASARSGHVEVGTGAAGARTLRIANASVVGWRVAGNFTIQAGHTFSFDDLVGGSGGESLFVGGNFANSGTVSLDPDTGVGNGPGLLTFFGGAAQTVNSGGQSFGRVVINQSPASTVTVITNALATSQTLTVTSGTLDLGSVTGNSVGTGLTIDGGTLQFGTAAQNPSITVTGNFLKSSGTLTMNSATDLLDANANFTVTGGGSSLTDGDIHVAGDLDISGASSFIAPEAHLVRMDGPVDETIVVVGASNTLGTLQILKSASTNKITTAGNVTAVDINVEEGILEILAHTVTQSDDAISFDLVDAGAELRMQTAGGVLNARGDFIMGPSTVVTISDGEIYIGDDLSANAAGAAFDPTGGTVIFAVTPANSIQRVFLDGNDFFHHLTISPPATTTTDVWQPETTATLTINGNFTLNAAPAGGSAFNVHLSAGAFTFTMVLAGNFTMVTGAFPTTFHPSTPTHTVAGNWDDSGGVFQPAAGTIQFTGTTSTTVTTGGSNRFFHFRVDKDDAAQSVTLTTALTALGNVTIASGGLDPAGFNIAVGGNWDDSGGTFVPASATVTFNGVAPATQTITAGATNNFYNLTLNQTGGTPGVNALDLQSNVIVKAVLAITAGRMNIRANTLTLQAGGVTHTIGASGALRHFKNAEASGASDSTLLIGNASTLSVSGWFIARYSLASGDTGRAITDADGGGANRYSIVITSGANVWIRQARFNRLNASGLRILTGSVFNEMIDAIFDVGTAGGVYLNLTGTTGTDRSNFPYTCAKIQFLAGPAYNVRASAGTPLVRFQGATGALAGESFDDDPAETELHQGRVHWESGHVRNVDTGETFSTIADAIADPDTVSGHRIRCLNTGITESSIDFSVWGKDVILENFTLYSRTGMTVDGGSSLLGQLQNCVIARGGADFVTLRNCTLFDPTGGTLTVTNCAAHNSVFEEAAPGLSTDVNNRKGVASSIFVAAGAFDFHLAADDGGSTQGSPAGWVGPAVDWETHARSGNWDRGADEFVSIGVTKLGVDTGTVSRFHWIGGTRGSSSPANGFAYLTSRSGSTTAANDNTLYVVNLSTMAVVAQTQAVGPIVNMAFWVDVSNSGASWRAWVYLVVDTDGDGFGDAIQLVVDRGDAGLVHPDQPLTDPDPYDRRFGSVAIGARYVYRPGAAGEYRIRTITLATVIADGTDSEPETWNSPAGTNRANWNRMFFSAYKTTATAGGALIKVNTDPYDVTDNDNQQFGETIWSILPPDYNFDYEAPITFTWASGFQEIFVSVSQNAAPAQTVLVRYNMVGTSAPAASRNWQATEEAAGVDENRFGATLDGGDTNASCVYGISDGTVIYNRTVDSASGSGGLRWASRLKNGAGTPQTPVLAPQRFFPNAFALVAYDGGVNKIWSLEGTNSKNGCLASSGLKLDLSTPAGLDEVAEAGTQDLDWPMACEGKPIQKIWVRGTKIYFGTDQGYVYGRNWNRDGSSVATGDETTVTGYPYVIPGGKITWIFVHPTAGVLIGTDHGSLYRFAP